MESWGGPNKGDFKGWWNVQRDSGAEESHENQKKGWKAKNRVWATTPGPFHGFGGMPGKKKGSQVKRPKKRGTASSCESEPLEKKTENEQAGKAVRTGVPDTLGGAKARAKGPPPMLGGPGPSKKDRQAPGEECRAKHNPLWGWGGGILIKKKGEGGGRKQPLKALQLAEMARGRKNK